MMKKDENDKPWEQLTTVERRPLLGMDPAALARRFNRPIEFFIRARDFYKALGRQTVEAIPKPHNPPKDLVISARRDLSFYEANFELFDNSIDGWRRSGAQRDLHITVDYELDLLTGRYADTAGGMDEADVYKVFIPGETTNRNFQQNVIGSFGMGAKKGIFRLTDGAKVISCKSEKFSATSEVPERWELSPAWETLDGRAAPLGLGTTEIYFYRLFSPPTLADLAELVRRTSVAYAPLIQGSILTRKVHISVNGTPVEPCRDVNWSAPKGAEPRVYKFRHTFKNFLETGNDIALDFEFRCGLLRQLPGRGPGKEPDWGIDVFGNGRLIQQFLKDEFGFGQDPKEKGMSKQTAGSKYFRGQLFINGHSFAIPWDTHKREYLHDHPVSLWIREHLRPVIKAYTRVAGRFAAKDMAALRTSHLEGTEPTGRLPVHTLPLDQPPPKAMLPQWSFGPVQRDHDGKHPKSGNGPPTTTTDDEESQARISPSEDAERVLGVTLTPGEYDDLCERFEAGDDDELGTAVRDCLMSGIAFTLDPAQLHRALKTFKCDGSVAQLSEKIKTQLLKKLSAI